MAETLRQISLPPGFGQTRGSEHEVWLNQSGDRVIKATHEGEFGRKFGPERFATMSEYLDRVRLTEIEFGIGWRVEGLHGFGRKARVVSSQPMFLGKPPTLAAIREFMSKRQFLLYHTSFGDAWFRKEDGMLVSDAEPKNAVLTGIGIMPFDFLIAQPAAGLLRQAEIG